MKYSLMFGSIKNALKNTYMPVHIAPVIITCVLFLINKFILKSNVASFDTDNIADYLNGLSILSTFFIFSIQGINFKYINETYTSKKNKKRFFKRNEYNTVTTANELRLTCYSLSVISFALIFLVYILLYLQLFKNIIGWLFLFTIIYIFNALIFTLSIWNTTNTK